jgi:hypothetical protein
VATALAIAGAWGPPDGHAQIAGSVGIDSVDRYRGEGADGTGAVVAATLTADTQAGLYGALSAHYNFNEKQVTVADALVGWSGRFSDPARGVGIDPAWVWDVGFHRRLEGGGLEFGTSEWMAGLLGPGFDARVWYTSSYFGTGWESVYVEVNAAQALGTHCQVFAHLGRLHYAAIPYNPFFRPIDHTDGRIGASWSDGRWTLRLARDAMLNGPAYGTYEQRRPAWIAGAEVAF